MTGAIPAWGRAISSTSPTAITPPLGGKRGQGRRRYCGSAPESRRDRAAPGRRDAASTPGVGRSISGADHVSVPGSRWHQTTGTSSSDGTGRHALGVEIPPRPPSGRGGRDYRHRTPHEAAARQPSRRGAVDRPPPGAVERPPPRAAAPGRRGRPAQGRGMAWGMKRRRLATSLVVGASPGAAAEAGDAPSRRSSEPS